jgi:general transcription factor IIIA
LTDRRYTCVHLACLEVQSTNPTFYPTWTALQHHIRTMHPPTCPHSSCNGKTFSQQKGLRAHLKIHEQREVEEGLNIAALDGEEDDNGGTMPVLKRPRGGTVGRDWVCDIDGCTKDFKSVRYLLYMHTLNHSSSLLSTEKGFKYTPEGESRRSPGFCVSA